MSDVSFDAWMILTSMVVVLGSYLLICYADRSWLNWATTGYMVASGAIFVFPLLVLLGSGPTGTRYAYFYFYLTDALTNLCTALAYLLMRRVPPAAERQPYRAPVIRYLPWVLLGVGILFYAPIIIRFWSLLLTPREIYIQTRSGYGPLVFGSRAFLNLAFVLYLFKQKKTLSEAVAFFTVCVGVVYLHGSKGLLVNMLTMAMLYWVYVKGRKIGMAKAAGVALLFVAVLSVMFTLFGGLSDPTELLEYVEGYSDYTKNAMLVIDDPARVTLWGRLTIEAEYYARIPRFLDPSKPQDFGMFYLAEHYYPAWYRSDAGNPDFSIGMQYTDFGPLAIVFLCVTSTSTGLLTGWCVRRLQSRPSAPNFILLLFFSGVAIVSFGSGYALPESILLAAMIKLASTTPWRRLPRLASPPSLAQEAG